MSVYKTHKLSAREYQAQLKTLIKSKEGLKTRITHAAGSAKVDFAYGYDISSRRNNAQSIIDDFTAPEVGIVLSAAQRQAILDWGAGRLATDLMLAAVNPASGELVTAAQADALLGRSLSQYEATFIQKIQTIDNTYKLNGALVAEFSSGSIEKIQLLSKTYNAGTIYRDLAKPVANNDVAEFAVQMAWMYSSVHDGNAKKYSAGLQLRFQQSAQAIIDARLSDPAIYPNGATAADRAAMATALLSRIVANAPLISAGIKGMEADKFSKKPTIDSVKNGFQSFVNGLVTDLGGGFEMKSNLGVLTLVVSPGSTSRTVSQWASLLGIPETALQVANSSLFHGDTLAPGSFKMPTKVDLERAGRMDQLAQKDPTLVPANRAQFDALLKTAIADIKIHPPRCFAAGTAVLMASGATLPIEDVQAGDLVMAFDGFGPLQPRRVVQVHRNVTDEFLLINGRTLITPNHFVFTSQGRFQRVGEMLAGDAKLVEADGTALPFTWERRVAGVARNGTTGEASATERWPTYNLTVEDLHTYVADGIRVHNDSVDDLMDHLGATIIDSGTYDSVTGIYKDVRGQTADGVIITMNAVDVNHDNITDAISYTATYKDGTRQVFKLRGSQKDYNGRVIDLNADYNWKLIYPVQMSAILSTIGSSLGNVIGNGDPLASVAGSSLLSSLGGTIGALVDGSLKLDATKGFLQNFNTVAGSISTNLATAFQGAAIGSVSSALTLQLGNSLGLSGFGAELFQTAGSTVLGTLLNNSYAVATHVAGANLLNGFSTADLWGNAASLDATKIDPKAWKGGAMASAIGSYLGAKLGSLIVSPTTQAGVALSSIGSAIGTFMFSAAGAAASGAIGTWAATLAASLGHLGDFVVPGLGSLIGFVLGALIGNLFGKKKPKVPTASAETVLQIPYAQYQLGTITVANNGNRDLVTSMAATARDTLNSLIGMVAGSDRLSYVSNLNGAAVDQRYGHTGNQIYVKINGTQTNVASSDEAVDLGVLSAIRNTKIVGGNLFLKRALALSHATNLVTLSGDLQTAADYVDYLANREAINGAIAAAPNSAFTAGYNVTFARIDELGINKWTPSDFYGGLQGFLSSFDLAGHGVAFENANFQWNGGPFIVSVAGGAEGVFSILPSASADGRTATIDGLDKIAYTWVNAGAATSGNDYMEYRWNGAGVTLDDNHQEYIESGYYQHNGWDYEWIDTSTWETREGGDDIFVGSQYGDVLYGRSGWDWLDGQAGNDTLEGGDHNDVLLGGAGADLLLGGAGDDYLAGGDGDDNWSVNQKGVRGGAGNDILLGGAGGDEIYGEDGDDILIVDQDGGNVWDGLDGGAGSDTASFERFTFAIGVQLEPRAGFTWNPDARYIYGDPWISIENMTGSRFDDYLWGDEVANVLKGGDGSDHLDGRLGNDVLEGGVGADFIYGRDGVDTVSYVSSSAGVYVDLSTGEAFGGDAEGDLIETIENLRGSKLADQLKGNAGANQLEGLAGDDWLVATAGSDTYDGGEGKDFVDYSEVAAGVSLYLGGYTATGVTNGYGYGAPYGGPAAGHVYVGVEGVVGSAYRDTLTAGDGDQTFVGAGGNDDLAGGAGADTYVLNRGDGYDTVNEDATGWNTFSFGESISFNDLWIGASGGASGWLDVGVRGTSDVIRMVANFGAYPIAGNNKLKSIDLNGAGQLDVGAMSFGMAGDDNANTLYGGANRADLVFGYNGNDAIFGVQAGQVDQTGDVFVGGWGHDSLYGSSGDDQYAYDRAGLDANGAVIANVDTIADVGGEDTLVFGSTVAAQDVIYQVVGGDLYVGAKDAANPALSASQVADRVRIVGGGTLYRQYQDDVLVSETLNTVEYVVAGGTSIDLRKLSINWTVQEYWNYSNYYPIALDLDGDGLNLSTVDSSNVVVKTAQGGVSRIGWVGPTDGFLAVDRDGDGAINKLSEISFVQDKPGATSDLEGLRTWDSNGDGVLDKADRDFSRILLFVDANQNGRSTRKELRTLEEAGIKAINLGGTATGYAAGLTTESFVQNTLSFVWADGRTGEGYDVALARRVLGSEGLYAGDYQAEWGARDEDGTLGQLLNDPKTAAKAARIAARKGLLDRLGASYGEVKAAAQLDFSDHDKVDAAVARRWAKMDASQKAAWLSGQASGMDGQQNLARLKAISSGQALANALNDSAQAGRDLVARGLAQAGAEVLAGGAGQPGGGGPANSDGLGVGFAAAGGGLGGGLAASQPLDGVVAADAAIGRDQAWWRGETDGGLAGAGSLAALLAAMDQGPGDRPPGLAEAADDPALLQQQMLLRQAMAGFGGPAGGSAAVWNRDAVQASAVLAASGRTTSPSAFDLALAS